MKKILNKRGSVLFLVVVVMALLLVAASATYYVIRNQHASANTHYNSEQSYQTAYSVSEVMETYLTNLSTKISKDPSLYSSSLFKKMMDLKKGETLNASKELQDKYGLGAFEVEIQKTDGSGETEGVFEITTRSEVNGETTVLTQVWKVKMEAAETKYFTRFLTSTGYRDEDVYLTANEIYGDAYFENPFTSAGISEYRRSTYCAGTLVDNGIKFRTEGSYDDLELVVAENYYIDSASGGSMTFGALYVGGNFVCGKYNPGSWEGKQIIIKNVYVMGDYTSNTGQEKATLFIQKDCYIDGGQDGATYYIGGDLHIDNHKDGNAVNLNGASFYVNGNVYIHNEGVTANNPKIIKFWGDSSGIIYDDTVGGKVKDSLVTKANDVFPIEKALSDASGEEFTSWNSVVRYISNKTAKGLYKNWKAEDYFDEHFADSDTIMLSDYLRSNTLDWNDFAAQYPYDWSVYGDWSNYQKFYEELQASLGASGDTHVQKKSEYSDDYLITITESCTIQPATGWSYNGGTKYILIDTTKSDREIYIKLDPNGEDFFAFGVAYNNGKKEACANVNVLVKGPHPVIFILPDGVDFKMGASSYIGHLDIALAMVGGRNIYGVYTPYTSAYEMYDDQVVIANVLGTDTFNSKADHLGGLTYSEALIQALDDIETDEIIDETTNEKRKVYTFDNSHWLFDKIRSLDEDGNINTDEFAPHNNIFLVSTGKKNKLDFNAGGCVICGYIYAPNTLLEVNNMSHGLAFLGGLIVGSYSYYAYTATLVFVEPYDPYDGQGSNIANYLMGLTGGGIPVGQQPASDQMNASTEFLGYK